MYDTHSYILCAHKFAYIKKSVHYLEYLLGLYSLVCIFAWMTVTPYWKGEATSLHGNALLSTASRLRQLRL